MISFQPFRNWFYRFHPTKVKSHITKEANISWATVNKIFDDKTVQVDMVAQLCKTYNLRVEQVIVFLNKELDEQNKKNEVAPTVVT